MAQFLGYIFQYKISKKLTNGKLCVSFVNGVSETYPLGVENQKDFVCEEIYEGAYSDLVIPFSQFKSVYDSLFLNCSEDHFLASSYPDYQPIFTDYFDNNKAFNVYLLYSVFFMTYCELSFNKSLIIDDSVYEYFNVDKELYSRFIDKKSELYYKEIDSVLS